MAREEPALQPIEIVILLVAMVVGVAAVARVVSIPYPILLVLVGLGLAAIPGLPSVPISPDLVFLVFLPPILWSAAYFTTFRDFRANLRSILLLAVGLVLATTAVVAFVAQGLLPGLGLAGAVALGAIVSPPDAVAATAVAGKVGLPRRLVTILEGESLVNDATALVIYHAAIAAVVTGEFHASYAVADFLLATGLGVTVGIGVCIVATSAMRFTHDGVANIAITLLSPYVAWVLAERFHASGVLACVAGGLFMRRHMNRMMTPSARLQAHGVWQLLVFLLNGVIFVLIGLQLRPMTEGHAPGELWRLLTVASVVLAAVIVVRLVYVPISSWLPRALSPSLRARDPMPPLAYPLLVGWIGMRGIVTLAAALALPFTTASGAQFPYRVEILLTSFVVVLGTLLLQGLSLPWLLARVRFPGDTTRPREELQARTHAASLALRRLDELAQEPWVRAEDVQRLRAGYERRVKRGLESVLSGTDGDDDLPLRRLQHEVLAAERQAIFRLRDQGVVSDEVLHHLEQEIDIEAVRSGLGEEG